MHCLLIMVEGWLLMKQPERLLCSSTLMGTAGYQARNVPFLCCWLAHMDALRYLTPL